MAASRQWQLAREAALSYEQILVPSILGPAAQALVEWANPRGGESVLDVGCGTGAAARDAALKVGDAGRVVGVDLNAGMIDVARSLPPVAGAPIEWRENSASDLRFGDAEFDVVLSAQMLQFLEDRPQALVEMLRVLKPGGRFAVSVWCEMRESPYFQALVQAMGQFVSPEIAAALGAAFALSDADKVQTLLTEAGFQDVTAGVRQLDLDLPRAHDFVPRHVSATPMAEGFKAASEEVQQTIIDTVAEQLASYETSTGMRVPFSTHLMMARKS